MSDEAKLGNKMSLELWNQWWDNDDIVWHKDSVNKNLEMYIDIFTKGEKEMAILIPLCGKSLDLIWLAKLGHRVVGVECVEKAIVEFSEEQNVVLSAIDFEMSPGIKLYQGLDGRLKIYRGDFFQLTSDVIGRFDAVWDRGSLVAMNLKDRQRYYERVNDLLKPGGSYLLEVYQYDTTKMDGPPHSISDQTIQSLYGNDFTIEKIREEDALNERRRKVGHEVFQTVLFLMKKKL